MGDTSRSGIRLAELIASMSLATDLGLGLPQEHVLRQTVVADRIAAAAGFDEHQRAAIFYVSLLAWVGCVADSHELAGWFGDDQQLRLDSYQVDKTGLTMMRFLIGHLAPGATPVRRISVVGRFMTGGIKDVMDGLAAHCQTTGDIARRLGLPDDVQHALTQVFERWDGKGTPKRLKGEQIEKAIRVVAIADDAEMFRNASGMPAALAMLRSRSGTEFDPALVDLCLANPDAIFADINDLDPWSVVIDGCRPLDRRIPAAELPDVLATFGDYADLKSPYFVGHSRATADLAEAAARGCGATPAAAAKLRRATLVSRLGVIGVSAGIWAKPGPLSVAEQERVRTVPYLTERVLSRQRQLSEISVIAAMRCERMDGSGYPRGLAGKAIPAPARLLAATDVYQALCESRPHRAAFAKGDREPVMHEEVTAGRLDGAAVSAVLAAAGHRRRARPTGVRGLTEREVEVLGLLARGCSNKETATRLSISAKTVGTHIEHIYAKIGASTRGAAAMFAMQHGLVDADIEGAEKIG